MSSTWSWPYSPDSVAWAHDHDVRLGTLVDAVDHPHPSDRPLRLHLSVVIDIRVLVLRAATTAAAHQHPGKPSLSPRQCLGQAHGSLSAARNGGPKAR